MLLEGIIFDKDGTIFGFDETWIHWCKEIIEVISSGDRNLKKAIAKVLDFDLKNLSFRSGSIAITASNRDIAGAICSVAESWSTSELEKFLAKASSDAPIAEITPLIPFFNQLRGNFLKTGINTNDSEMSAISQLNSVGIIRKLDFVAGYDSGYEAKPSAEPLLAFAKKTLIAPEKIAMVGDSVSDLVSGKLAGMKSIAVLTGPATESELAPYADVVLSSIRELPKLLDLN